MKIRKHPGVALWIKANSLPTLCLLWLILCPSSNLGSVVGTATSWGNNDHGQTNIPTAALSEVASVAVGHDHTLALKSDGTLLGWGADSYGETSIPLLAQRGVTAVSAGFGHSIALRSDGTVIGWGRNDYGQASVPQAAQSGISAISAGWFHNLALKRDGSVVAWGNNANGISQVPAQAQTGVISISAGSGHSAVLKSDGSVYMWGSNEYGQTSVPPEASAGVVAIATGDGHTLALKADGTLLAWGYNSSGQTDIPLSARSGIVAIGCGGWHSLALKNDGTLLSWGRNESGQTITPESIQGSIVALATGSGAAHTVVLANSTSILPRAGLVSSFAADGNASDLKGNHHGNIVGGVSFQEGVHQTAFGFDGLTSSVDVWTGFDLQTFTLSLWIREGDIQAKGFADILDTDHRPGVGIVIEHGHSAEHEYLVSVGGTGDFGGIALKPESWQHFVLTRDQSGLVCIYIDGQLIASKRGGPVAYHGAELLRLARWGGGGRYWKGDVDEFDIYERGLSQTEVLALYKLRTSTAPRVLARTIAGPITSPINGHVYYLLDESDWNTAEAMARRLRGHLASIRNQQEQDWIFRTFSEYAGRPRHLWIGLYDTNKAVNNVDANKRRSEFAWTSGEAVTYQNWASTQPDNTRGDEFWGHMFSPSTVAEGLWNDGPTALGFGGASLHGVVEVSRPLTPVTSVTTILSGEDLDRIIYVAACVQSRYRKPLGRLAAAAASADNRVDVIAAQLAMEAKRKNPNISPQALAQLIRTVRADSGSITDETPNDKLFATVWSAISRFAGGNPAVKLVDSYLYLEKSVTDIQNLIAAGKYAQHDQKIISDWHAGLARELKQEGVVLFGVDPELTASQQLAASPGLKATRAGALIDRSIQPDGSLAVPSTTAFAAFEEEIDNLSDAIEDTQTYLQELTDAQTDLSSYIKDEALRARDARDKEEVDRKRQEAVDGAKASFSILGTVIGFGDPKLGNEISTVGSSAVTIVDALGKLTSPDVDLVSWGSAILTGNIAGALMNIVTLFGNSTTPSQLILEEIGQVKHMIVNFSKEMNGRFDRVDRSLNAIFTTMTSQFEKIDLRLGRLEGNVEKIADTLGGLHHDLFRMERELLTFLDVSFRREFKQTLLSAKDWRVQYTGETMPWETFQGFESAFYAWAILHCKDAAASGVEGRSTAIEDLQTQLNRQSLEYNLNYIGRYLSSNLNEDPFGDKEGNILPNLQDWIVAADAYADLGFQFPFHMRRVSVEKLRQIKRVGEDLERALHKISTRADGTPNSQLFAALFSEYRRLASSALSYIASRELVFKGRLGREVQERKDALEKLDLWGLPNQATDYIPPLSIVSPGEANHEVTDQLPAPDNWQRLLSNLSKVGALVEAGEAELKYTNFDLINRRNVFPYLESNPRNVYSVDIGDVTLDIEETFSGNPLDRWSRPLAMSPDPDLGWPGPFSVPGTHSPFFYTWGETRYANSWSAFLKYVWDNGVDEGLHWKNTFSPEATPYMPRGIIPPARRFLYQRWLSGRTAASLLVRDKLHSLQLQFYNDLALDFQAQTDTPLVRLAGLKQLIDALLILGFPEARNADQVLQMAIQQLPTGRELAEICKEAQGHSAEENFKIPFGERMESRIRQLDLAVSNQLAKVPTSATSLPMIREVLDRLDRLEHFLMQPTLAPAALRVEAEGQAYKVRVVGEQNMEYAVEWSPHLNTVPGNSVGTWTTLPEHVVTEGVLTLPVGHSIFIRSRPIAK